jgi:Na+/proline symporter
MSPAGVQRVLMGSSIHQAKKAFVIAAVLVPLIYLGVAWIPFLIFNVNPNIQPNDLLPYIVDNYTYTGLKGLIIIGVAALAMSTADSCMNSSSVLFSHDLCGP